MERFIEILEEHIKELEEEKVLYGGFLSRKEAIENLLKILEVMSKCLGNIAYDQLPIALGELSYELGKYQAKSEEDEAVIEEMAEYIGDLDIDEDICKKRINDCYVDMYDDKVCKDCVKDFFRTKVKGEKE